MRIYKYYLEVGQSNELIMPEGSQILKVAEQDQGLYLWATFEPGKIMETRFFKVIGTGKDFSGPIDKHVGTALCMEGRLVWHVFEEKQKGDDNDT